MTPADAVVILKMYENWNAEQRSVSFSLRGERMAADDIYDARRDMLLRATRVLAGTDD
jgi:hypothetical protein